MKSLLRFYYAAMQVVKFIHELPILVGRNLTVFVNVSKSCDSVVCEVYMHNADVPHQDCEFTPIL